MPRVVRLYTARAALVLLVLTASAACSLSMQRSTAIASEQLAAGTVRLMGTIEAQHQTGQMPEAEYRSWKRALGRVARSGLALNAALATSNGAEVDVQVRAIVELLDELMREDVIRLPADSRLIVMIVMESLRTSLLVISAASGG